MVRVVAEGKSEVASLQVQLANSDRGNEQLLLLQKDLANRDHKIQVMWYTWAEYTHVHTHACIDTM